MLRAVLGACPPDARYIKPLQKSSLTPAERECTRNQEIALNSGVFILFLRIRPILGWWVLLATSHTGETRVNARCRIHAIPDN